jgi:hypothetical protein
MRWATFAFASFEFAFSRSAAAAARHKPLLAACSLLLAAGCSQKQRLRSQKQRCKEKVRPFCLPCVMRSGHKLRCLLPSAAAAGHIALLAAGCSQKQRDSQKQRKA